MRLVNFLSSGNQLLQFYDNQEIAKEPEADDQVVPVIMGEKCDGTIDFIDNFFKAGALAKTERVIKTWENPHGKFWKE